jgi:parvulin-like peptidyl-prolyl isomerase
LAKKKRREEKRPREYTRRQLSHFKKQQRRQRFILFGGISIIAAIILIILGGWLAGNYLPLHKTILEIYDTKINTAFFMDTLEIVGRTQDISKISTLTDSVMNEIIQDELIKRGAAVFGISVSDAEVTQLLSSVGIPVSDASMALGRGQLLPEKMKSDYMSSLVPESDTQAYIKALMVEDENVAYELRDEIMSGANFTLLVQEYAQDYYSKSSQGDFGYHPASIFVTNMGTTIPEEFAFGKDVKTGAVSSPLSDNASYKQVGYWLIRVNERPAENSANVSAILLKDKIEAALIRSQLAAGGDAAALADQYSQYTGASGMHGELGIKSYSDNVSDAFNGYVFNPATELGKWSDPIRDTTNWTKGGYWVVQVVEKEENRILSDDDRNTLINNNYNDWSAGLWSSAATNIINKMTDELKQWAVDRVIKELQQTKG